MQWDGDRIAQPPGAREKGRGVAPEKEDCNVGTARRLQHQDREELGRAENQIVVPHWPGDIQTPGAGRVEDVLAVEGGAEISSRSRSPRRAQRAMPCPRAAGG